MKKRFLALLVAVVFGAGSFSIPISASAQGTSGQSVSSQGQKATTKKKQTKKKSKSTAKKKSQGKKKTTSQPT